MKRLLYKNLIDWKNSKKRKPLLLQGARQVGKTYLVNQFGKDQYLNYVYLNFEQDINLRSLFESTLNPRQILENIGLYLGEKINHKDTLLFFDEIQIAPEVLTSLKYFNEQLPEFHIIAAGSLLGVSIAKNISFPVGKVNFLTLHPMNFQEYLLASKEDLIVEKLESLSSIEAWPEPIHDKMLRHLKSFLFVGGMPEVLQSYINEQDIKQVRVLQNEILEAYKRDFSKYTEKSQVIKTTELWNSIPAQLAKENKKFKYGDIRKKARAATFENTIEWLKSAGLINIAYNLKIPKLPTVAYLDHSKFKIYLLDTGLMGAMLNLTSDIIIKPNELFTEFNGAFIENFVASELSSTNPDSLKYWTSKSDAEVDFILELNNEIYPLEVKSGLNRNIKSLRSYSDKYQPKIICRTSPRNFTYDNDFVNVPLYAISFINEILSITNS